MKNQMMNMLSRFSRDEDGATLVEYGVALTIVVAVGVGAISMLGDNTRAQFDGANAALGTDSSAL